MMYQHATTEAGRLIADSIRGIIQRAEVADNDCPTTVLP
jgi:hypothetical protein